MRNTFYQKKKAFNKRFIALICVLALVMGAFCVKLGEMQIDSVLLEGGGTLNGAFMQLGLVDRVQAYIAPKLIGGADAKGPVGGAGIPLMCDAQALLHPTITRLGDDILIEGRIQKGCV